MKLLARDLLELDALQDDLLGHVVELAATNMRGDVVGHMLDQAPFLQMFMVQFQNLRAWVEVAVTNYPPTARLGCFDRIDLRKKQCDQVESILCGVVLISRGYIKSDHGKLVAHLDPSNPRVVRPVWPVSYLAVEVTV